MNSQLSGNFRASITLLGIALALLIFAPAKAHAQPGTNYGFYPGFLAGGANCWTSPSGGVRCATAIDACKSTAYFYAEGGTPAYYYLVPNGPPHADLIGDYDRGISCAWPYIADQFVGGLYEFLPPGVALDPNSFPGYAPPQGVQTSSQIGGGKCGCSANQSSTNDNNQTTNTVNLAAASQSTDHRGNGFAGEPVNVPTGNMAYSFTDYATAGQNPLGFTRYYNSRGAYAGTLGVNWRSSYDRYIWVAASPSWVAAQRADGQLLAFNLTGGVWTPDADVDYTLTNSGSTWILTTPDDTVETYTVTNSGYAAGYFAQLNTIRARNGYTKTLAYNGNSGLLTTVTDSYGRTLTLAYNASGMLKTVTTPDSTTITYGYTSASDGQNLSSVTFPTSPAQAVTYVYADTSLPSALTGVIDEDGNTFLTWTYDAYGRALTSQVGSGANATITTISYNDTNASRVVTNPLGVTDTYSYSTMQNAQKVSAISRAATSTTAAATETFANDSNGYVSSRTDWNGNQTIYTNNGHGLPTTINEAVGSPVARTTAIVYDSTFVHLPDSITSAGLTTSFIYDASGDVVVRTLTDTTTTTAPYSTNGQTRTWTNTWSNFLLASTKSPNRNTTAFGYDSSGALVSITDALSHVTNITAHTGGGLPQTIVDPNNVTTTLTYDPRQRLLSSSVSTNAGARTTTYTYDAAGDLTKTTLPDGSALANTYDTAHRLTTITDLFHQNVAYTLDALSDRTRTNLTAVGNRIQRQHTDSFDALGRVLADTGGVGQTTTYAYDPNGNALTVTDPLGRITNQAFDALNRLSRVTDPNGNATAYIYDGFGDLIQQLSPDSGQTVYHYDADGNPTSKTNAAGNVTNNTYDALDRILTTTYPADSTLTVAYVYDQTGHGFGVGRLTSLTDAAGTLSRSYDERANLLSETRVNGATTLQTIYTYDPASRVASIAYPSGWTVSQTRDIMGRIYQLPVAAPGGASSGNAIANATYEPFGPLYTLSFGNGVNEARRFDLDYRVTSLTDAGANALQNLTYVYDANDNVSSIADGVTPANSQTLGYDVLNRLTSASGVYGSLGYTYDPVGNRLTQTLGGAATMYGYTPGTNRLASITAGGTTTPVSTAANGNISAIPPTTGAPVATLNYSAANRLASVAGTTPAIIGMVYDAFGRRLSKTDPGSYPILYTYDQVGNLLEEADGHGLFVDYIYLNGRPVAEITGSTVYYLHADRLGTPQLATDGGQNVEWSTTYQPFGTTPIPIGSITQNLRLPGQYFDGETGFDYNLNRDYVPSLGRYSESDPIGLAGGLNPFRYANANPGKFVDLRGTDPVGSDDSQAQCGTSSPLKRANQIIEPVLIGDLLDLTKDSPFSELSAGERILLTGGSDFVAAAVYNDVLPGGPQQADTYFDSGLTGAILNRLFNLDPIRPTAPPPPSPQELQLIYGPARSK